MAVSLTQTTPIEPLVAGESLWAKARKRFFKHRLAVFGLIVLCALFLMALLAPAIERYSPIELDLMAMGQPPSLQHWLGTDTTGRDVWSRIVHAGRVSLSVGFVAVSISTLIGLLVGGIAGYAGGRTDLLLMRVTDMVMAFPSLVMIITIAAVLGPSIYNTMLIIGVLSWPGTARLVRGQFLSFREQQFVLAARATGVPPYQIVLRHLLPNVVGTVTVAATFGMANAILQEASLSFLGLGDPNVVTWGSMISEGRNVLRAAPFLSVIPGIGLVAAVLGVYLVSEAAGEALGRGGRP